MRSGVRIDAVAMAFPARLLRFLRTGDAGGRIAGLLSVLPESAAHLRSGVRTVRASASSWDGRAGAPVRLTNRAEIARINQRFQNKAGFAVSFLRKGAASFLRGLSLGHV